jgi:hypothetical protein
MDSIFTRERRKDFPNSFAVFFEDLQTEVITSIGGKYKMFNYLDRCIRFWPHRCGATSINEYLKVIDIDITHPKSDTDLLLTLELLINLLYWAPKQDCIDNHNTDFAISFKKNDVENESDRLIQNAEYILEQCCNMKVRKEDDDECPRYYITKRDITVDSAVIAVPELSEYLLGYYDVRNQNDLEYKKAALIAIYGYLEPHRKEFKGSSCSTIVEEFFVCMNTFGIRHNTKSQIRMTSKKKNEVYNKLFLMAVYILQAQNVQDFKDEMKHMREKTSEKTQ